MKNKTCRNCKNHIKIGEFNICKVKPVIKALVRLDSESYKRVLETKRQTGLSFSHIVSEAVKFALDNLEVREID